MASAACRVTRGRRASSRDVHIVLVKQNDELLGTEHRDAERFETLIHGDLETVLDAPGFDHDVPPLARGMSSTSHMGSFIPRGV
jgi:hypothetical protein